MSGHFATLLRETVRTLLADHDVYITDWHNARSVPMMHGDFGLDEYSDYVMQFLRAMGPGAHLLAVCQPCVAALAAAAVMAEDADPAAPISVTLMAGPVDCRVSPTEVNRLAVERPTMVLAEPDRGAALPGRTGRVPGFMQSPPSYMNLDRHLNAFASCTGIADGDQDSRSTRAYEEFAVADLPAEFISRPQKVFKEYRWPAATLARPDRAVGDAPHRAADGEGNATTLRHRPDARRADLHQHQALAAHHYAARCRHWVFSAGAGASTSTRWCADIQIAESTRWSHRRAAPRRRGCLNAPG
jgi:poly(3-hydroxybutyrate) depolymerase